MLFLIELKKLDHDEISEACSKIVALYTSDLNGNELIEKCQIGKDYFNFDKSALSVLTCIMPNLEILPISGFTYLLSFRTNVKDGRCFSKF